LRQYTPGVINLFINLPIRKYIMTTLVSKESLPPTTTDQEDLTTAGQRKINIIWEYTQSFVAIIVVLANMIVGVYQGFGFTTNSFPVILSSSLFLVIGFYFSRTNHAAIGGIGNKPNEEYKGR
jgi:hypothetical protein